ncbi:MAG TPA: PHP domain-containing protein [Actinocrinis sp.]|uniref:PHP domain-containing protein n=1 Tax=Actinocrinis sp. TaxID=1920516 RepID=UPI002DDD1AD0|nr:PHP domain-containing protein [Actinocrinis sp.]HEV2342812.1 PHP domain-containing protein [Actinocrinis sp.]
MRIDLHTHSSRSDGTDTPAELVEVAKDAGLDVLALTDHDTTAGWDEAFTAAGRLGVTVVPGAEISCRLGRIRIHLLAYGFDRAEPEFGRERNLLRDDRERRAELIVQRCQELGAPITWERVREIAGSAAIGRPHVASALVEAGVVATVDAAFSSDWLADNGRAYVTKYALDPFRALELVHSSGGVAVVAHPAAGSRGWILTDDQIGELARAGLRGIEADHVNHDAAARERIRGLAAELGLVPTGSSDYHGSRKTVRIGENTTDPAAYEELFDGMPWVTQRPPHSEASRGV